MKLNHLLMEMEQISEVLFSSNTPRILEVTIKIIVQYSVIFINVSKKVYT
jgi:hypothetical protein